MSPENFLELVDKVELFLNVCNFDPINYASIFPSSTHFRYDLDSRCSIRLADEQQGRIMVATESIKEGSVILVEKPAALSLTSEYRSLRCAHCLAEFVSESHMYPCDLCVEVFFCGYHCYQVRTIMLI